MLSVKSLKKTAYFPSRCTTIKKLYGQSMERWPLQFFVFAFDSDSLETVLKHVEELNSVQPLDKRIDMICVLNKGLIVNCGKDGLEAVPSPGSKLIAKETDTALFTFHAVVSNLLSQGVSEPVCINPYTKHIGH